MVWLSDITLVALIKFRCRGDGGGIRTTRYTSEDLIKLRWPHFRGGKREFVQLEPLIK